eukprot:14564-Chlamydomonas_euryale.AAC.1
MRSISHCAPIADGSRGMGKCVGPGGLRNVSAGGGGRGMWIARIPRIPRVPSTSSVAKGASVVALNDKRGSSPTWGPLTLLPPRTQPMTASHPLPFKLRESL